MEANGRSTPAAIIPIDTREEAIEELEAPRPPTVLRRNGQQPHRVLRGQ